MRFLLAALIALLPMHAMGQATIRAADIPVANAITRTDRLMMSTSVGTRLAAVSTLFGQLQYSDLAAIATATPFPATVTAAVAQTTATLGPSLTTSISASVTAAVYAALASSTRNIAVVQANATQAAINTYFITGNLGASTTLPAPGSAAPTPLGLISTNYAAGSSEVDFINLVSVPVTSFAWWQKSAFGFPPAYALMSLSPAGNLTVANGSLTAAPTTYIPSSPDRYGISARNSSLTSDGVWANSLYSHHDMIQGVGELITGSSITQLNGVAGYVRTSTPDDRAVGGGGGARDVTALSGFARSTVDTSSVWGSAVITQDGGSGTGANRKLIGYESDTNITQTGSSGIGFLATGGTTAAPTKAEAFVVSSLGSGGQWTRGFMSYDGAVFKAFYAGLNLTSGASVNSSVIAFKSTDSGSAPHEAWVYSANASELHVTGDTGPASFWVSGTMNLGSCPTSSTGLASGSLWCNSGVVTRVP